MDTTETIERALEERTRDIREKQRSIAQDLKALRDDLQALRSDLRRLGSAAATTGTDRLKDAKDRLWQIAEDIENRAGGQFKDLYDSVCDRGQRVVEQGREQLGKRPFTILAIALGVGMLLGKLSSWRR